MLSHETQLDLIEEVFNLFDTDGQQQLDEEELASAIFALGISQNDHSKVVDLTSRAGITLFNKILHLFLCFL